MQLKTFVWATLTSAVLASGLFLLVVGGLMIFRTLYWWKPSFLIIVNLFASCERTELYGALWIYRGSGGSHCRRCSFHSVLQQV